MPSIIDYQYIVPIVEGGVVKFS